MGRKGIIDRLAGMLILQYFLEDRATGSGESSLPGKAAVG
jgi:hypothetical protein